MYRGRNAWFFEKMISREKESSLKKYTEEMLAGKDLRLFSFKVFARGRISAVRVIIDHSRGGVTIDECASCNKLLRSFLEGQGVPGEDFEIEVYSPGIDMKLRTYQDFERVTGRMISVWFARPFEGKTYIEGVLKKAEEKYIILEGGKKIPSQLIKCAKQRIDHE